MLDRADFAVTLLWLACWFWGWRLHQPEGRGSMDAERDGAELCPVEYVRVPAAIRVVFGLTPDRSSIRLRPVIAQTLAILMAAANVVIRHSASIPPSSRLLELTGALFLVYILLVWVVSISLDRVRL